MGFSNNLCNTVSDHAPRIADLLASVEDGALIKLVLEAVHEFDSTMPANGSRPTGFSPEQTTTLLVYCYARSIFASEEIETRLGLDHAITYICAGIKPDWHLLRRFRRDHSLLILGIMTRLLELVLSQSRILRNAALPDRWRNNFREQALARLHEAIHADSMAMDE